MRREDALTVAEMLNEVQKGRYGPELFREGRLTNVGEIWVKLLEEEPNAEMATQAIVALYSEPTPEVGRQRPITPADFKEVLRMTKKLNAPPGINEPEFVREIESWVKGWIVARVEYDDMRVWPQQKEGYDALQLYNPSSRDYVWPEQIPMPEEKQKEYETLGANLSADQISSMLGRLTGA